MSATILVVDDESVIREVLALILADEGYRVRTARDAIDALALLDAAAPDLIVSDVTMPRMGGGELVERLRARGGGIPVILMSANYAAVDLLGVRFLPKPFDLDDLSAAVRHTLADRAVSP